MPFTFSHPAIVLPLAKASNRWFSLTGLVVGSIAPDFEYFIRMKVLSTYSHTLLGLIWFNIPVGLAVAFAFHGIVRNRLIDNLPSFLAYRFSPFKSLDWIYYYQHNRIKVISSILIGAVSHIAWDSFTHETGMMVETIAFLRASVLVAGKDIQLFKLLQHVSSFTGALAILLAVLTLPVLPFKKRANPLYWIIVAIIAAFVLSLRVASGLDPRLYGHMIVTGISGFMIGVIVASIFKSVSPKR